MADGVLAAGVIAWRVCKTRYDPWDPTGATLVSGRWHSRGQRVLYAADSYAGAILEVLVPSVQPRLFPGAHHAVQVTLPDDLLEDAGEKGVPGWDRTDPVAARAFGDAWLAERRSAALVVPALPARPIGRIVMINLAHPDATRIGRGAPFPVPWDERLL